MPTDIYSRITNAILNQLDTADPASWICPWHGCGSGSGSADGLPTNALTGRTYRGINILSLWCEAKAAGFGDDRWASYRQWSALGAQVRRGERGSLVVFYKDVARRSDHADDETSETNDRRRFVARAFTVFNAAQVDGAPAEPVSSGAVDPLPEFDSFVAATGAVIRSGGDRACYVPSLDEIRMPSRASFRSRDGYAATLAHELVHWTGARHRLGRDLSSRFGSRAYAAEELVAELGAAFVLGSLGLAREPHPQHAAYMAGWLPLLRSDPRAIFIAASHAARATDALQALQKPDGADAGRQETAPTPPLPAPSVFAGSCALSRGERSNRTALRGPRPSQ